MEKYWTIFIPYEQRISIHFVRNGIDCDCKSKGKDEKTAPNYFQRPKLKKREFVQEEKDPMEGSK